MADTNGASFGSWAEWGNFTLKALENLGDELDGLRGDIGKSREEIADLRTLIKLQGDRHDKCPGRILEPRVAKIELTWAKILGGVTVAIVLGGGAGGWVASLLP